MPGTAACRADTAPVQCLSELRQRGRACLACSLDVGPYLGSAIGSLALGSCLEGLLARAGLKPRIAEPDPPRLRLSQCGLGALTD